MNDLPLPAWPSLVAAVVALGLPAVALAVIVARQRRSLTTKRHELKRLGHVERDRLDAEVLQRTGRLTELAHHLQTAREEERHRIARNLHDELGALLTSAKLDVARIRSRLAAGQTPEALERLAHLMHTLDEGIELKRNLIEDLRPSALGALGLVDALDIMAREYAEQSGLEVETTLAPVGLSPEADLVMYRVVQEALTNIAKHVRARHVWIDLGEHDGRAEVTIRDDGVGFDTTVPPSSAFGLEGMRFRVEAVGGAMTLDAAPGAGTRVRARLPITRAADRGGKDSAA
jgi:signal transduction histidine kinase